MIKSNQMRKKERAEKNKIVSKNQNEIIFV